MAARPWQRHYDYDVPTEVEFRKEQPKSPVGKILRKVLCDEEAARKEPEGSSAANRSGGD